jgi:cysteinyl-tRNA synthetase
MIKFYSTLSKKIEEFKPVKNDFVRIYNCGPTVYDYDHLGHMWTYAMADIIRRVLEYNKLKVRQVMNITDVGHLTEGDVDKMLIASEREKKTPKQICEFYTKIFMENRRKLNILEPHIICKATEHIKEMQALIKKLLDNGYAYKISDGVYYNVQKFRDYGKLSGNTVERLEAGARIEVNPEKKHPADFALWIIAKPEHLMQWDSPWGRGYPGWHIECSAMSTKYLGDELDIHTGGEDNIFPHHENEIAQSEGATGKKFVRVWMHTRFLNIEGEKMSKSLGNFLRLQDIEKKGFEPLALRYLFLMTHYRTPLNFTWDGLKAADTAWKRVLEFMDVLKNLKIKCGHNDEADELIEKSREAFKEAINNDLNTPKAVSVLFDFMNKANKFIAEKKLDQKNVLECYNLVKEFDTVFAILKEEEEVEAPKDVLKLLEDREKARKEKDWAKADEIREKIKKKGFIILDSDSGPRLKNI